MKTIALVLVLLSGAAWATPGRVNASGCHNSKAEGYHCHPERAKAGNTGFSGAETVAQRDKRLVRECKGRPNAGACLGFAR